MPNVCSWMTTEYDIRGDLGGCSIRWWLTNVRSQSLEWIEFFASVHIHVVTVIAKLCKWLIMEWQEIPNPLHIVRSSSTAQFLGTSGTKLTSDIGSIWSLVWNPQYNLFFIIKTTKHRFYSTNAMLLDAAQWIVFETTSETCLTPKKPLRQGAHYLPREMLLLTYRYSEPGFMKILAASKLSSINEALVWHSC